VSRFATATFHVSVNFWLESVIGVCSLVYAFTLCVCALFAKLSVS